MCLRNQFLFHLFYTTDEGNYKLWKIRHTEKQTVVSLAKRISYKFFQCPQSPPPASTCSLQLPFVSVVFSGQEKKLVEEVFNNAIDCLSDEDKTLPQVKDIVTLYI